MTCILIGDDSFTISCANILLKSSVKICYIISKNQSVIHWGKCHQIQYFSTIEDFFTINTQTCYDYLFSASNSYYIPKKLISLIKKNAINYHDSLLPKYAGVNATTWAILNDEKIHGITWHEITEKYDDGDILIQKSISISNETTAFSLNLSCFEMGLDAFKILLNKILSNKPLNRIKQNPEQRSYYSYSSVIPNDGIINWQVDSAEYIHRLVRALSQDNYDNTVGTAKMMISKQEYMIVTSCKIIYRKSKCIPGTLLEKNMSLVTVSTCTYDVQLSLIHLCTIKTDLNILENTVLPYVKFETKLLREIRKKEVLFIDILKKTSKHAVFNTINKNHCLIKKQIFTNTLKHKVDKKIILSALIIYLWHLNNQENFVFLYSKNICKSEDHHLLPFAPISTSLDGELPFSKNIDANNSIFFQGKSNYMSRDIFVRISEKDNIPKPEIAIASYNDSEEIHEENFIFNFNFLFHQKTGNIYIYCNAEDYVDKSLKLVFNNFHHHMANIVESILQADKKINSFNFLVSHEKDILSKIAKSENNIITHSKTTFSEQIMGIIKKQSDQGKFFTTNYLYRDLYENVSILSNAIFTYHKNFNATVIVISNRTVKYIEIIVALLNLGYIFVPVEFGTPRERIKQIITSSKADMIICEEPIVPICNINTKTYDELKRCKKFIKPINTITPRLDDCAYIIFTSGTSGTPKGIKISQKNIMTYLLNFIELFKFDSSSIIDFSCSIAFDLSIPCIFAPLVTGGRISICSKIDKLDVLSYIQYLEKNKITHIETTPGYFNKMTNLHDNISINLNNLKWIILGAEELRIKDILVWHEKYPHHKIINEYGPSETTVAVSHYEVDFNSLPKLSSIPIGRPFANSIFCILNKNQQPVPLGCVGELYVSGDQVAIEYTEIAQTKERFYKLDFSKIGINLKGRFYNTGDLVRWDTNNQLVFIGRKDNQNKFLGYRIDYKEIENYILNINDIKNAIVTTEMIYDQKHLVCYFVSDNKSSYQISNFLKKYLPRYMIPTFYFCVPYIPLKSNEKIDFSLLFKLKTQNVNSNSIKLENIQILVREIWKETLYISNTELSIDFFSAGGNSISAMQLINRINYKLNLKLSIELLIKYNTVEKLASYIELYINKVRYRIDPIVELNTVECDLPTLCLIHPVGGSVLCYKDLANSLQGRVNVLGIYDPSITENSDKTIFNDAYEMVYFYANALASTLKNTKMPIAIGGSSFGANLSIEVTNRLIEMKIPVQHIFLLDGWYQYPEISLDRLFNQKEGNIDSKLKNNLISQQKIRRQFLNNFIPLIPSCYVTLFKAKEKWHEFYSIESQSNNWDLLLTNISTIVVNGDHETMLNSQNNQKLIEEIQSILCVEGITAAKHKVEITE